MPFRFKDLDYDFNNNDSLKSFLDVLVASYGSEAFDKTQEGELLRVIDSKFLFNAVRIGHYQGLELVLKMLTSYGPAHRKLWEYRCWVDSSSINLLCFAALQGHTDIISLLISDYGFNPYEGIYNYTKSTPKPPQPPLVLWSERNTKDNKNACLRFCQDTKNIHQLYQEYRKKNPLLDESVEIDLEKISHLSTYEYASLLSALTQEELQYYFKKLLFAYQSEEHKATLIYYLRKDKGYHFRILLHYAVWCGDEKAVEALIKMGFPQYEKDYGGRTLLDVAAFAGNHAMIHFLKTRCGLKIEELCLYYRGLLPKEKQHFVTRLDYWLDLSLLHRPALEKAARQFALSTFELDKHLKLPAVILDIIYAYYPYDQNCSSKALSMEARFMLASQRLWQTWEPRSIMETEAIVQHEFPLMYETAPDTFSLQRYLTTSTKRLPPNAVFSFYCAYLHCLQEVQELDPLDRSTEALIKENVEKGDHLIGAEFQKLLLEYQRLKREKTLLILAFAGLLVIEVAAVVSCFPMGIFSIFGIFMVGFLHFCMFLWSGIRFCEEAVKFEKTPASFLNGTMTLEEKLKYLSEANPENKAINLSFQTTFLNYLSAATPLLLASTMLIMGLIVFSPIGSSITLATMGIVFAIVTGIGIASTLTRLSFHIMDRLNAKQAPKYQIEKPHTPSLKIEPRSVDGLRELSVFINQRNKNEMKEFKEEKGVYRAN